jgi:hypothetical protein
MFIHRFPGLPIIDRPEAPAPGDLSAPHHPSDDGRQARLFESASVETLFLP